MSRITLSHYCITTALIQTDLERPLCHKHYGWLGIENQPPIYLPWKFWTCTLSYKCLLQHIYVRFIFSKMSVCSPTTVLFFKMHHRFGSGHSFDTSFYSSFTALSVSVSQQHWLLRLTLCHPDLLRAVH